MSFVDEMYKPKPNPYIGEHQLVDNLGLISALENATLKNKDVRHFDGFYYEYNGISGDGDTGTWEINSSHYSSIDHKTSQQNIDWDVVKRIIYDQVRDANLGYKSFEVEIYEKVEERKEREKYNSPVLGRPRYRSYTAHVHCLRVKATW